MNFYVVVLLSASVYIAGIIGLVRFRKLKQNYYPFIFFVWAGCINELISFLLVMNKDYTYINSNIYVLVASVLILIFFKTNDLFKDNRLLYYAIFSAFIAVWLYESFFRINIHKQIASYFRIFSSLVIILLSISLINSILLSSKERISKYAPFLICVGLILFYTYKTIVEAFSIYGLESSQDFQLYVWYISVFVNFIANLIYALAVLWIPKKQPSILPC